MQNKRDKNYLNEIIRGNLVGGAMLIILLLISAVVILKLSIRQELYIYFYIGSLIFSSGIASVIVVNRLNKRGSIYGIATSILPSIISLTATCVVNKSFSLILFLIPLISVVSSAAGGITAVNLKLKNRRRKRCKKTLR